MELLINQTDLGRLIEDLTKGCLIGEQIELVFIRTNEEGTRWYQVKLTRRQVRILTRTIPRQILIDRYHSR